MTKKDKIKFLIVRSIGNFLVLFAIFGVFATFGPALYYEASFRIAKVRGVEFTVGSAQAGPVNKQDASSDSSKGSLGFANVLTGSKEQILTPVDSQFSIVIPQIGANARVLANVDPSESDVFLPALRQGVAHAKGTFFPGQKGNIYLFAHSTDNFWDVGRYNAIFYLLKDLKQSDEIAVFFQNIRHNYVVKNSAIVNPSEVSYITSPNTGKELLILQTCWPPGTTWQRLIVFAEPK